MVKLLQCKKYQYFSLEISVKDTGIGIAKDQQKRVFDVFTQSEGQSDRKYGGTGLGLSITNRLTNILGGTIQLESELGKGSIFTIFVPQVSLGEHKDIMSTDETINVDFNQISPLTILVVDDVASNRELLTEYFNKTHHKIVLTNDGQEAIQQAKNLKIDLILMDLQMPNIDGYQANKILKQQQKNQKNPIIILSAYSQEENQRKIKNFSGFYLKQPVNRLQLLFTLKELFPFTKIEPITTTTQDNIESLFSQQTTISPE